VSSVEDLKTRNRPLPKGLPATVILPSPPEGSRLRTEPIPSRESKDAEGSARLPQVAPALPQATEDLSGQLLRESYTTGRNLPFPVPDTITLDRPGPQREPSRPTRPRVRQPLTHPRPWPPRPAHNIRPASALRHPSRAKPRARSRAAPLAAHAHMHTHRPARPRSPTKFFSAFD
jgi:hypothetical protein